ncbi:MAG: 16S rRNA (cytosine(1402)-N(4))-methyltransferase RsmH [Clostridiales bacterium]|nr:16S rRNA (cytosine(1402)-N(4))-methyltransferase RsmH [Clostridiales bacterium]
MYHVPVLFDEVMSALNIEAGKLYLDCTLGGGGHSSGILERGGKVIGIDRDDDAIAHCKSVLSGDITYIKGQYEDAKRLLEQKGITKVCGAVMDLGVSSHQLDDASRGFSYMHDGALDMRMDKGQELSARDVVNGYSQSELESILRRYGEESFSRRIAENVVKARKVKPIETTHELSDIIVSSVPHRKGAHPAKKTFQAIRIEVNGELKNLYDAITDVFSLVERGGRLCVISFHSLEDRIVKAACKEFATDCVCPKYIPVCVCNHRAIGKPVSRLKPGQEELDNNPRSASATLRVIEKLI